MLVIPVEGKELEYNLIPKNETDFQDIYYDQRVQTHLHRRHNLEELSGVMRVIKRLFRKHDIRLSSILFFAIMEAVYSSDNGDSQGLIYCSESWKHCFDTLFINVFKSLGYFYNNVDNLLDSMGGKISIADNLCEKIKKVIEKLLRSYAGQLLELSNNVPNNTSDLVTSVKIYLCDK
tara:strand:+ start:5141 stop:5671 length:531 start_codon:yes stop_codon:yes gene_type:complete